VPGRVLHDAYVSLGLKLGEGRAGGLSVGHRGGQILHLDIEVDLHLRVAVAGRPHRANVAGVGLE
jgi:hypothetical protein